MNPVRLAAASLKACGPLLEPLGFSGAELHLGRGREILAATPVTRDAEELRAARTGSGNGERAVDGLWWYSHALALGTQHQVGQLIVGIPGRIENPAGLIALASHIEREWSHREALESLSVELGNRYEELNLLYGLDNVLDQAVDKPLTTLINEALKDCVEFLDIDAATVWAPTYDLNVQAFDPTGPSPLTQLVTDIHQATLKKLLRGRHQPLVLNGSVGDPVGIGGLNLPYRVVAAPISQGAHKVAGTLCLLRTNSSSPFTNGDRKLARVLAAEISKTLDARFDSVTGCMNREAFEKLVAAGIAWAPYADHGSLVHVDLDQFKLINDACGHEAGDRLLRISAALLRNAAPKGTIIARVGPDEFATIMPGYTAAQTRAIAVRTQAQLSEQRFIDRDKSFQITASTGITEFSRKSDLSSALMEAELACQAAKELGGARVRVYERGDQQLAARHSEMRWASAIRTAIEDERLTLYGQAICNTQDPDGPTAHYEVLLRMFDEENKMVSPAVFIPAAERYGLIAKIDRFVVTKALETLAGCRNQGVDVCLTVNLSGTSLADEEFRKFSVEALSMAPIARGSLSFEITETAAISSIGQALNFIAEMQNFGCRFLLDDFGAGMSSYSYLRQFPVEYVKIDGSFVKSIDSDPFNRSIVESIHHICQAGGKKTVAEFVENDAVLAVLQEIGVDYVQGYRLDKPSPLQEKLAPRFDALRATA